MARLCKKEDKNGVSRKAMEEISFTTENASDGLILFGRHFPVQAPKAVVSLVHGLGEHSGRYTPMAEAFAAAGIATIAIDLRGHGQSQGKRGVVRDIDDMLEDIDALVEFTATAYEGVPHILMGHSMGGLLVLSYGLQHDVSALKGIISQAPAIEPAAKLPGIVNGLMKGIRRVAPGFAAGNGLKTGDLSRVPQEVTAYEDDPLVHDRIGAGLYLDLVDTGTAVVEQADNFPLPLLLMHGTEDAITLASGSAAFAQKAGANCTYREIEGGYHEIHNDLCREDVYQQQIDWMNTLITKS
jgi:alpha-beta hydrolase superfamily lysophospholipase